MAQNRYFTAKDKLEVANNIREAGFDMSAGFIGDVMAQVEKYWRKSDLPASDNPIPKAVYQYIKHPQTQMPFMVINDGSVQPVGEDVFAAESNYNFLPEKYRTYVPPEPAMTPALKTV